MELSELLQELHQRRQVCCLAISMLQPMDDPRAPDALEEYKRQLSVIDGRITAAEKADRLARGIPEPEPIVVGVKPALLSGKTKE